MNNDDNKRIFFEEIQCGIKFGLVCIAFAEAAPFLSSYDLSVMSGVSTYLCGVFGLASGIAFINAEVCIRDIKKQRADTNTHTIKN